MARQQVLSSIPQNRGRATQNNSNSTLKKPTLDRNIMTQLNNNRRRSASLSSLSSISSPDSTSRDRPSKIVMSPSASPDENKVKKDRLPFTEMFSPVRAIRAARAGMKRKRGGGPLLVASTRGAVIRRGGNQIQAISRDQSMDTKRAIRGTKRKDSRDISNTSLHQGMKALVLTDNEAEGVALRPGGSSRKASATGSVRSNRSRLYRQGREESEDEMIDDAEEGECRMNRDDWT